MTAYEDSETRRANIAFIKRSMETGRDGKVLLDFTS